LRRTSKIKFLHASMESLTNSTHRFRKLVPALLLPHVTKQNFMKAAVILKIVAKADHDVHYRENRLMRKI
jgi:hypothetical protein